MFKEFEHTESTRFSLVRAYDSLGLVREISPISPKDTSPASIAQKITSPKIAEAMGATPQTVKIIYNAELTANLLDSFSETGDRQFLQEADGVFQRTLDSMSPGLRELILGLTKSAMTYFYFESAVARRIKNGDQFLNEEAVEYLLRRGADSVVYAAILQTDNITSPGLIAGFRVRQALWDLRDDIQDLDQDRNSIGANVLLLATLGGVGNLRRLAHDLFLQGQRLDIPVALKKAIQSEYELTTSSLSS